ncbi:glycosyltransferase [Thermosynechococcus sp. TG252]|uniref:glycosyltransferase n=1 Tax=Thermosynechococcus sp. TG252 TaxID=3074097 RepID=UPI00285DCF75|nr:glycosyltransferase [Thermosynechococcus sp. TG252]MDR7994256.1 glycosyltransferase [Thermosynechococcus sp. TG252]
MAETQGSRVRVAHVTTGLSDGGAEAVLYRLVRYDPGDEHHVFSLTTEGKYGALLREAGVEVTALGMPRGRLTTSGLMGLWRAVRRVRPDVVQTWMYHGDLIGGMVGRMLGLPVVWGIHNTVLTPKVSSLRTRLVAKTCGLLSTFVPARIITCSTRALEEAHASFGYKRERMVAIPNGVDVSVFCPDEVSRRNIRAGLQLGPHQPLVGMVARFDPYKDHANLFEAIKKLRASCPDLVVALVGSGMTEANDTLCTLIKQKGLAACVRLMGPRLDIPAIMNALDIHVLSSSAESFGNVLIEAMACGTPCVATDVGDAARIVGETGWIVPPRDSAALAQAIFVALTAHADRESWLRRQSACRARIAEHFSIGAMVQRYRAVWREAAGHGRV